MMTRPVASWINIFIVEACLFAYAGFFLLDHSYLLQFGNDLLNTTDHAFYSARIHNESAFAFDGLNNLAIKLFYAALAEMTGLPVEHLAYLINIPLLLTAFILLENVHLDATGHAINRFMLLGLTPVLAFVPLINKDAFGIMFYAALVAVFYRTTPLRLGLLTLLLPFRVQHLAILALTFMILAVPEKRRAIFIGLVYALASFAAAYSSMNELLFNPRDATGTLLGMTKLTRDLNDDFFLGSLVLNFTVPLRYFYDLGRSISWDPSTIGMVTMSGRCLTLLIVAANPVTIVRMIYWPHDYLSDKVMYLAAAVVCSFFLVWMISPIIHYRYLLNIVPILILGLSIARLRRNGSWTDLADYVRNATRTARISL